MTHAQYKILRKEVDQLKARMNLPNLMRALSEIMSDPDFGYSLTAQAKKRLRAAMNRQSDKFISLSEIKRRYL